MPSVVLARDDRTTLALPATLLTMNGFDVSALEANEGVLVTVSKDARDAIVQGVHLANQYELDPL